MHSPDRCQLQLNDQQTAEYVTALTKAIAEYPYRMADSALACVMKMKTTGGAEFASGDGSKKSLQQVWMAQLQMIRSVSAAKAAAIVRRYPSFRSLMEAYRDPRLSEAEKDSSEMLLDERAICSGMGLPAPAVQQAAAAE